MQLPPLSIHHTLQCAAVGSLHGLVLRQSGECAGDGPRAICDLPRVW